MNRFLFAGLLFLMPLNANALPESQENLEKLEKELSLPCSEYGEESCTARFIAMSACTFVFGINQGKPVGEALDIADGVFVAIMRGNKIKPISMFNKNDDIKTVIRNEVKDRVRFCKDATEEAIPKIVLERTGKEASAEFIEVATRTYGEWWLRTLEGIKKGRKG
tara:strand:- start:919 stop:1413 length:495 start_codon:yes stop_codon:yes gene_type:complete